MFSFLTTRIQLVKRSKFEKDDDEDDMKTRNTTSDQIRTSTPVPQAACDATQSKEINENSTGTAFKSNNSGII